MQDYKRVEVILSDDSPNEDIKGAVQPFREKLAVHYYHNKRPLKSPVNWNAALDKAKGDLVVLMHQDDWYHSTTALTQYIKHFENASIDFVFCQNTAVDEKGNKYILQAFPDLPHKLLKCPNHLLLAQVIGPPSNTMLRRNVTIRYDERLIWLVDVDYYVRLLKAGHKYRYIPENLVTIGLHEDQTTVFVRNNDHIILKENILFAAKLEKEAFEDIKIYDYYWRLLRNHKVRNIDAIVDAGVETEIIPPVINQMLRRQSKVPSAVLKFGPASKTLMCTSYIIQRFFPKKR